MLSNPIGNVDVKWSKIGDFMIKNGTLEDTENNPGLSFQQEVTARIMSSKSDWTLVQDMGANLEDFEGEINNSSTGKRIAAAITKSLVFDEFLGPSDFMVEVIPVSESSVLIKVKFSTLLTNQVLDSKIIMNFVYDLNGKGPFFVR